MMPYSGPATLTEDDLAVIEKLAECRMGEGLKRYLLQAFGEGGERDAQRQYADANQESCEKEREGGCYGCGRCGADHPLLGSSLLHLVSRAIDDADCGVLDPDSGEYHIGWINPYF